MPAARGWFADGGRLQLGEGVVGGGHNGSILHHAPLALLPCPGGQPCLRVLPSTSIPWACKVENELDPSHVLPCCHLVSFLFFRLKWPQNIGSSEIVRISNRVIYAGRDLTGSQGSLVASSSSLARRGAPTFGGGCGVWFAWRPLCSPLSPSTPAAEP